MNNRRLRVFSICLSVFFSMLMIGEALASFYYVSTDGSDSNPGTESQPFKTIQKAANIVNAGDTVIVKDGTYTNTDTDNYVVFLDTGGTSGNWITFRAENKWGAVIDGANKATFGFGFNTGVNYVRIEDFEIKDITHTGIWSNGRGNNLYFYRNWIHGTTNGNGIFFGTDTTYHTADSNVIHDIGSSINQEHGIYLRAGSSNNNIINNIFYDCSHGWPIHFWGGVNNNVNIINNTFVFDNPNREGHIVLASTSADNIVIQNNVSYGANAGFVRVSDCTGLTNVTIKNNITDTPAIITSETCGFTYTDNIVKTDPGLVNTSTPPYDFSLRPDSKALDKGYNSIWVSYDHDNNPRPQGSGYDIGAFELIDLADPATPGSPSNLTLMK